MTRGLRLQQAACIRAKLILEFSIPKKVGNAPSCREQVVRPVRASYEQPDLQTPDDSRGRAKKLLFS